MIICILCRNYHNRGLQKVKMLCDVASSRILRCTSSGFQWKPAPKSSKVKAILMEDPQIERQHIGIFINKHGDTNISWPILTRLPNESIMRPGRADFHLELDKSFDNSKFVKEFSGFPWWKPLENQFFGFHLVNTSWFPVISTHHLHLHVG